MSTLNNSLLLGAPAGGASYTISRSLRFNSADSASLSRTPGSVGNRKTWTWAGWVKRSDIANLQALFSVFQTGGNYFIFGFATTGELRLETTSNAVNLVTTQLFRDTSAWLHLVLRLDTTQSTAANRARIYVNGQQVQSFNTPVYPTLNSDLLVNEAIAHDIGKYTTSRYLSGYLADIHFIDSQSLDPTSFGEFSSSTGVWMPKAYTGTYGTNGFHLEFEDNSSNTATTLGKDTSGNGNNWTPNNLSVINLSGKVFATEASASASGGVIPNGGTPYWVDILPTTADLHYSGNTFPVHDGNLNSGVYWVGDEYSVGNVMQARFDLRDFPTVSSVRLYAAGYGAGYVDYSARLLDANKNPISGTTITISGSSFFWRDIPVSGSPRYIEIFCTSGTARRFFLNEIEVNGIVLVNNVFSTSDSLVDVPVNGTQIDTGGGNEVRGNYATLNPLWIGTNVTLTDGNLVHTSGSGTSTTSATTIAVSSGKWYCEFTALSAPVMVGIIATSDNIATSYYPGYTSKGYGYYSSGAKYNNSGANTYGSGFNTGDVIGIAFDADSGNLYFYKNGVVQNSGSPAFTGLTSGPYAFATGDNRSGASAVLNAGQRPFAYTAPSGYKALCTANLPAPTIAKPSTAMDVRLYTGNGGSQTISGLGFSPDLVWMKSRSAATDHALYDTVRGATLDITSQVTGETTQGSGLTAFNSDGFSIQSLAKINTNNATYVAWCFDAGSSTASNTSGTITSQVRANTNTGFSILTYTGTGSNGTIGHGLGVVPHFILTKRRDAGSENWGVYHVSLGNTQYLNLNATGGAGTSSTYWQNTTPTSTVFSVSTSQVVNWSGGTFVAYCFAPVAGYSSFGSYTGNASADGPFVYTGFRPEWLLIKNTSSGNWVIVDATRPGANLNNVLFANLTNTDALDQDRYVDFVSNGFKIRSAIGSTDVNSSSQTHIYAAFAESPFQYARAR